MRLRARLRRLFSQPLLSVSEPMGRAAFIQGLVFSLLAALTGIACGLTAVGFRELVALFSNLFLGHRIGFHRFAAADHTIGPLIVLTPVVGGLLVGLISRHVARETKGHGVPEVMEAVAVRGGRIRPPVAAAKALASALTIGSGGSAGREGPIVQISSALASAIGQFLHFRPEVLRILVASGAAGGIAATFNTPIAGVLFAFELILLELKTRSFIPLVVSSVFATIVARIFLGPAPAFTLPPYSFVHPLEIVFYLGLGLLAGVVAVVFIHALYWTEELFNRFHLPEVAKPALGGLGVGLMALGAPQILGVGYETVVEVLREQPILQTLLLLAGLKIVAVCLTIGSGGSGGVFSPSLFIGAALGGAYGFLVHQAFPEITASYGAYAIVGMAAVFAGTSRATLTAIIILFEMTREYQIILPLMFACVVSDGVAYILSQHTIYTRKLARRGVIIRHDMEVDVMDVTNVRDVMRTEVVTVIEDESAEDVARLIIETGQKGFPVLGRDGKLVGIVTLVDLKRARDAGRIGAKVSDIETRELVVTYPDESLKQALSKFIRHEIDHLPVVGHEEGRLAGLLTRADVVNYRRRRI